MLFCWQKLQNEIIREEESLKDSIRETIEKTKQTLKREILDISGSEEEINTTTTLLDYISNSQGEVNIKVEGETNIEANESETADSDIVYCKSETKKRKKKNSKCGNSKKIKASERIRKRSQDAFSDIHKPYREGATIHSSPHSPSTSYSLNQCKFSFILNAYSVLDALNLGRPKIVLCLSQGYLWKRIALALLRQSAIPFRRHCCERNSAISKTRD